MSYMVLINIGYPINFPFNKVSVETARKKVVSIDKETENSNASTSKFYRRLRS